MQRHVLSGSSFSILRLLTGPGALTACQTVRRVTDEIGAAELTCMWPIALAVAVTLLGHSPKVLTLRGAILCFGFAKAAMDVAMNSWATEVERHIGESITVLFHAMWSVGAGTGALGGHVAISFNQSILSHFVLASLTLGVVLIPALVAQWNPGPRFRRERYGNFVLPRGALIFVSVIAVATSLGEEAMANWSAVYLHDVVGVGQSYAALGFAACSAAMVITRLVAGAFVVRYGPVSASRASGAHAAHGVIVVIGIASTNATAIGSALMGVGYASIVPLAFSRAATEADKSPGEAIASGRHARPWSLSIGCAGSRPYCRGIFFKSGFRFARILGAGNRYFGPVNRRVRWSALWTQNSCSPRQNRVSAWGSEPPFAATHTNERDAVPSINLR